jgi:hypothetical protein
MQQVPEFGGGTATVADLRPIGADAIAGSATVAPWRPS